ncbi:bifunctional 2-polyprenyl-6-hydroxyphenol methylase/3-demethylubiquinol 3-O-methyltransferase UbiG [Bacteroides sp. 51]|uniref:class I SAM-dependent methyltransferase n=1 Tax=Bacteroides sp. 51 TaxID=2302938 RepID=UPI0013D7C864|nr:class I SAM-dependent methyltransferase [Bacteroides sp. 51]NDV83603.1 class I SAM-dependent methyltransferase [Bacteroides sp. 51]
MKENKYDDSRFFAQYSRMSRSVQGLQGAGEWHILRTMLPDFTGKRVLDLGCGFGWHCRYAVEHGATKVVGVDLSANMLNKAREINNLPEIEYLQLSVEDYDYPSEVFDIVISSLTFHYIADFDRICKKVNQSLTPGGAFIFSVEHPVFTAYGNQDWCYDADGNKLHWPVDRYFIEGERKAVFLGEEMVKYHKTLTTYINGLLMNGFEIKEFIEPQPTDEAIKTITGMEDELRRPMMLIVSALKKA